MKYVKYGGFRINLEQVIGYRPWENKEIMFITTSIKGENTQLPVITWTFDTEKKRDEVLSKVDKLAEEDTIELTEDYAGEVSAEVL